MGSAQYLGADHDNSILLPAFSFYYSYIPILYWYFYNVTFMLEIIVVNCIVLNYYNTYNISN